jgi:hypothetical protein
VNYYAGIGSRETPEAILDVMELAANKLAKAGWICRTGGAPGADGAFVVGAASVDPKRMKEFVELYLPWANFEGWHENDVRRTEPQAEAFDIAEKYHPGWKYLKQGAKKLIARNTHQVMGYDVTNPVYSKFVLCWTPQGKGGGGTGQAIRNAKDLNIPVYDLGNDDTLAFLGALV